MPWKRLMDWFPARRRYRLAETSQLTLVTLSAVPDVPDDQVAFYREAEFQALVEWARMGRFVLALSAMDRDELTLLCIEGPDEMETEVRRLPLVAARLAAFDVRPVMPLRLVEVEDRTLN